MYVPGKASQRHTVGGPLWPSALADAHAHSGPSLPFPADSLWAQEVAPVKPPQPKQPAT